MNIRTLLPYLFAALFATSGIIHFVKPEVFLKAIPPALAFGNAALVNQVVGGVELLLALLLVIPATRNWGAWLGVVLLVALLPSHVYTSLAGGEPMGIPVWVSWLRTGFQFVLIYYMAQLRTKQV